jgi:hypothetical protein
MPKRRPSESDGSDPASAAAILPRGSHVITLRPLGNAKLYINQCVRVPNVDRMKFDGSYLAGFGPQYALTRSRSASQSP